MTSNPQHSQTTNVPAWLKPHRDAFIKQLSTSGYSLVVVRLYERMANRFCHAVAECGLRTKDLHGTTVEGLRKAALDGAPECHHVYAKFCLGKFLHHLVEAGAATLPESPVRKPTAMDRLREEYEVYLRHQRGLSEASIIQCQHFLRRFTAFRFGTKLGNLNAITTDDIVAFLGQLKVGSRPSRDKTPPTHLRTLFKFLFWSGKTRSDLGKSIPRVAQPQPTNLPRYLKADAVQQLLDATRAESKVGRRDYAMLMLMARLGLRAPEVIAIQLEDIDWRAGEILIRGKGKRQDRMPLPTEVGKAIANYIQHGRTGASRALFVIARAPYSPFPDAQILNIVLRKAFQRTGLKPPQKYVGSHVLRHSLATDMLGKGASLDEIGDVLRHRSRVTTTIYAKLDIEALRSVARVWPVEGEGR